MNGPAKFHTLLTSAGRPVSRIGVGCGRLGSITNPVAQSECRRTLVAALDCGINHFDTADIYGQGDSERILARAIGRRRGDAFVLTKIGYVSSSASLLHKALKPVLRLASRHVGAVRSRILARRNKPGVVEQNFSTAYLESAINASLSRLGSNWVDGLLLHNPSVAALEDPALWRFLKSVRASGKARYVGVSVLSLEEAEAALQMPDLDILQMDAALCEQIHASRLEPLLSPHKVTVMAYGALRAGRCESAAALLTPTQAIARTLAMPHVQHVLVGISTRKHLEEIAHEAR